ncbi:1-acyl-sn-glycerol-3-phosphate acyltransferase [Urechidicola vernalis]|uniref:1-acyl-sn-glycerol-3-phosphate acyltransferase n=1 Tax=Urechidicola vernalis TaxID=3075600 RepID=A0ABU2Y109_9FLAO|nr:1-acyl-sn-glycerol-3-phosphate acyltransferase [Urechidicola sp. P050]MDT0551872.1 1-acyl-sn-glycerol-3-phosphate acyltransferase [Urechidicola sp. P050]
MIYNFLRVIVKITLFFFYKKTEVFGKSNIPKNGPLIIVSNHPSTMTDPLLVASIVKQRIGFIANAGIFKNKLLAKILTYLHIIPIYRKKDVSKGEKPDNASTFIRCHQYLEEDGTFLIFPEGSSYYELKLRDIKTGTARIALSYEEVKEFNGNLKIVPITLDYSDSIQFRSTVSITVNPPIDVSDFKDIYYEDNFKGVKTLTERIRVEMAKNIPHTEDKNHEEFLIKLHKFYASYFNPIKHISKNSGESLWIRNNMSKILNEVKMVDKGQYNCTKDKIFTFFDKLKEEKLSTGFLSDGFLELNKGLVLFSYVLQFSLLFPFYFLGLVANYIPYMLPYRIFKSLKIDLEYKTSVQMVTGLFTFPLFYVLEIWLLGSLFEIKTWMYFALPLLFIVSGYIAMYFYLEFKRFLKVIHYYFFVKGEKKVELILLRDEIMTEVEKVRENTLVIS